MGVRLAEGEFSLSKELGVQLQRRSLAKRRRSSGRARRIRFATWTLLAVMCVCVVGSIARPARTGPSKGRQPPVAVVIRAIPPGLRQG
jgi:hypothetical protein